MSLPSSVEASGSAAALHAPRDPAARRSGRSAAPLIALIVAVEGLTRNKSRTVLATLGIIIGVGCFITMMGLGQGTAVQIEERIRRLGSNTLSVRPGEQRVGTIRMGRDSGTSL